MAGFIFKGCRTRQLDFEGIVRQPSTLQQFDGLDRAWIIRRRRHGFFFQRPGLP